MFCSVESFKYVPRIFVSKIHSMKAGISFDNLYLNLTLDLAKILDEIVVFRQNCPSLQTKDTF